MKDTVQCRSHLDGREITRFDVRRTVYRTRAGEYVTDTGHRRQLSTDVDGTRYFETHARTVRGDSSAQILERIRAAGPVTLVGMFSDGSAVIARKR